MHMYVHMECVCKNVCVYTGVGRGRVEAGTDRMKPGALPRKTALVMWRSSVGNEVPGERGSWGQGAPEGHSSGHGVGGRMGRL